MLESYGNRLPVKAIKGRLVPQVDRARGLEPGGGPGRREFCERVAIFALETSHPTPWKGSKAAISYSDDLIQQFDRAHWRVARKIAKQAARRKRRRTRQAPGRTFGNASLSALIRATRRWRSRLHRSSIAETRTCERRCPDRTC